MTEKTSPILVLGASGATGRLLVNNLLEHEQLVRVIVRSTKKMPDELLANGRLTVIRGNLLDLSDTELAEVVAGCRCIASCLGHNLTLRGIFGPPHRLVTEAVRRVCQVARANPQQTPIRFILMNTVANRNRDLPEPVSMKDKIVISLLRRFLPPHADNEKAAEFLRVEIGQSDEVIGWVAVRPDTLIDESTVSHYSLHPSPIRSAIFDPGSTSRINVAHFMASLIMDNEAWGKWRGRMPVIYNPIPRKS